MQHIEHSYEEIDEMQQMAATIRKQITNATLMAIGAREYRFLDKGLHGISFKVNHGRARQYMVVTLTVMDDYTVELRKLCKTGEIVLEKATGIYCNQLGEIVYAMVNK